MSFLSDVLGAGASFAMGNPLGAADDLVKGISSLFSGGNSQSQVQQQLSQLDQALKLPPGTLENIINSNQQPSPFGMDGGPSGAMQQAMNTMQEGMNQMQGDMNSQLGLGGPGSGASQSQAMQQALNAVHDGEGEVKAGMQTLEGLRGQHGQAATQGRHLAMNEIRQGMSEAKSGMNALHNLTGQTSGLSPQAAEQLKKTIGNQLEQFKQAGQDPFANSMAAGAL